MVLIKDLDYLYGGIAMIIMSLEKEISQFWMIKNLSYLEEKEIEQ